LPPAETPFASSSILDSLDGAAPHVAHRLSPAVAVKSDAARNRNLALACGRRNLRLLSWQNNTCHRDYHAERSRSE
jgi:hypothetical protein